MHDHLGTSAGSPTRPTTLRLSLLGPVEVSSQGQDVTLSPLELNLLVVLAIRPGVAVSTDRLVDQLWGDRLPTAPRSRLQGLVSGLRRRVGDVVKTRYPGYLLDPDLVERDVDECDRLVAAARAAASPAERVRLLAAAQDVWRGDPLVGVSTDGVAPERARLAEQRLTLLEARSQAELALGNHGSLISLLAPAVEENPFREQLAGLFITALYRSNRQADALGVYHRLRERLADELGSDVCPELRELYARILHGEGLPTDAATPVGPSYDEPAAPAPRTRPAQLPAPDGLFLGRSADLRALAGAHSGALVVVSGPGGLGKTALVVEWAHRVSDDYPDGQLYFDLDGGGLPPEEAVGAALVALGVAPHDVPAGVSDRIGLYRTLVRDRRLLVVADNAGTLEQVLALVPPGNASRMVVTTRRRLVSLTAHHEVHEIVLDPLAREVSAGLLTRLVGAERCVGPAADALVDWCGGWPLLLRHVGATLAFRLSQSVSAFVAELEGAGADDVLHGDPRSVHAALASAHASLTPAAASLFERLALHSGAICLHLASVAAGTTLDRSRRLLDELVGVHLLVETGSGEFRFHDVVARFGRRLAVEQEWTTPTWGEAHEMSPSCLECRGSLVLPATRVLPAPGRAPVHA